MKFNEETPSVNVKRKNISLLMEYCVENKIEFSVKPLISRSEEFEMDFTVSNNKTAVALGMYLKELRIELNGTQAVTPVVASVTPAPAKASRKSTVKESTNGHSKEEPAAISFDSSEKLEFAVETTNN